MTFVNFLNVKLVFVVKGSASFFNAVYELGLSVMHELEVLNSDLTKLYLSLLWFILISHVAIL